MSRLPAIWNGCMNPRRRLSSPASTMRYKEGVLTLHDGFALDLNAVLPDIWAAQVIQQRGPHIGILSRAALGGVVMPYNEQGHDRLL